MVSSAPTMAAAASAVVSGNGMSPSAPPPLASRSIPASLGRALRRVATASADAVCFLLAVALRRLSLVAADACICLYLGSLWLSVASFTTADVGRFACGSDCPLTVTGYMGLVLSLFSLGTFSGPFVLVFLNRVEKEGSNADLEKAHPRRNFNAALQEVLCRTVILGVLASIPFLVLMFVGGLLNGDAPIKAGQRMKAAYLISAVGVLGKDVLYCFIILPTFSLRVWKVTRPGWGYVTPVEQNKSPQHESAGKMGKE